ncbi:MAG TPA: lasso peptide biosynthesis B2 protein [Thermoanaerobaculia bacterium]|nr:lasso peptide biosynthesis B2 protein [Thermoanaerobaculia bacterium]
MSRIAAWFDCARPERRLLVAAWLLLLAVWAALRCMSLPRVQALLHRVSRSRLAGSAIAAERLARLVRTAARCQPWKVSCLERSLVLQAILSGSGSPPQLKIGVRRDGEALQAHAWVEIEGRPVGEAPDISEHFQPFSQPLPQ